jgi:D-alanyl-D-alanine carboxypeptidase/D-alanyl-D-alanine-endopeptidase (penicillin-binding protein 4)
MPPRSELGAVREVPLGPGPCTDWRSALQAESTAQGWRFNGRYPVSCGTQSWPLAAPDTERFGADLLLSLWEQSGGRLRGRVRSVLQAPAVAATQVPVLVWASPPLGEAVRDINKFSNNVMAQQLFLTLARQVQPDLPATGAAARASLRDWAVQRLGDPGGGELIVDNGSGLSRHNRLTAQWLARLLQHAWSSPVMPEFVGSLPVSGIDGTLRRSRITPGLAHLKTGSLRDVVGLAGYVQDLSGQRHVLVALVQHPQAQAARPALEALVEWLIQGAGAGRRGP